MDNRTSSAASTTAPPDTWPRNRRPRVSASELSRSRRNDEPRSNPPGVSPLATPDRTRAGSPLSRSWLMSSGGSSIQQSVTPLVSGLWENSWSALQGISSTMLGGGSMERPKGKTNPAMRPPPRRSSSEARNTWLSSPAGPSQWGPEPNGKKTPDMIASGGRESRDALIRAKRRESLLDANEHAFADSWGTLKRRKSDDQGASSSTLSAEYGRDSGGDSLVYLHHVRPHDTVAGVIIQFNCQPAAFRRANRLWPNDPIQCRQTVVLPVEACGVKGRPLDIEPAHVERPRGGSHEGITPNDRTPSGFASPVGLTSPSSRSPGHQDDPPWKHESWVHIEGLPSPVEIVRMPRKTLGFFPPRRRRSTSVDLDSPSHALEPATMHDGRSRRDKSGSSSSTSYFAQHLQGPGGVGTLGGGTRSPGPGPDGLNKYLAPHLPRLAPPRDSFESVGSNVSVGLEQVGSAIEGWVKKVATKAATIVEHAGAVAGNPRVAGDADLIELSDGFEGSDDGHLTRTTAARAGVSTGPEDVDRALRERFPMWRRIGENGKSHKAD